MFAIVLGLVPLMAPAWQLKQAPLMTDWAQLVDTNSPLPEYPRPQLVRNAWLSLNGIWQFQAGTSNGPVPVNQVLSGQILVPFPMESALSGVMSYQPFSWYRRTFSIPSAWAGQRILLHLDAVNWESKVYVNGSLAGDHKGGYDPITYDITASLSGGTNELLVWVYSPQDNGSQPRGKQTLYPGGIMYTSSSGIWQPVWLEPVPASSVASLKLVSDIDNSRLRVTVNLSRPANGITANAVARAGASVAGSVAGAPNTELMLPVPNPTLWWPTNPYLYDLVVTLSNGPVLVDSVSSYFGMRKISLGTTNGFVKLLLNNQFVFQFGPLDQGFWPDGLYTAPTDDALRSDLDEEKAMGFNMVRKHIKVERPRWYYWADKLGLLVWQDMPSCNSYTGNPSPPAVNPVQFVGELSAMITNHWNSPAIIMWDIFNEAQGQEATSSGFGQTNTAYLVQLAKALDPSRLVNQASGGNYYGVGDVLDSHSYPNPSCPASASQAVVNGEFGGVGLGITNHTWASGWGYVAATNGDDLASQFEGFCYQLSDFVQNRGLSAAVYTQITDVETELNGLCTYDRKVRKPDATRMQTAVLTASTPLSLSVVLPTSQTDAQTWRYTTTTPTANWVVTNYDDSPWQSGPAGFGAGNPPNTTGLVRTTWNTADIWLRRTFNPGTLTAQQVSNLVFFVYHDEDVEIYLNGVLAGSAAGYTTDYVPLSLNAAGQAALRTNTTNLLAVHCHQTSGGQFIDVGMVVRSKVALPVPTLPATPDNLVAVPGPLDVGLTWTSVSNATSYNLKRSLVSGGPYTNVVLATPVNAATDSTVTNNATYFYVVSAVNAAGESGNSGQISVTTPTAPPVPPPQLVAWFKADGIKGLVNGAPLATWPDFSGNTNDATQVNVGQRPTYATGAINGLPVVRFNAANNSSLAFPRVVQDDFSIICVFQSSQGIGTGTQFYQGAGLVNGEVANVVNDFGTSLNANGQILAGTGNPDVTLVSANGFNDRRPHLLTFSRVEATGALCLYVDGLSQGTAAASRLPLTSPPRLVLGAQQTGLNFLSGDIAEVLIYNAALSASDRTAAESALQCKYGLGGGAPPPAPTGLTALPGTQAVLLSWSPRLGAGSYQLGWSTNSAGPFSLLAAGLSSTSYADARALDGITNYYVVAAADPCGTGPNSTPVAVVLPSAVLLPLLSAGATAGGVVLSWPAWASGWNVWRTTNLTAPILWSQVTNSPVSSNGLFILELPLDAGQHFFRLQNP